MRSSQPWPEPLTTVETQTADPDLLHPSGEGEFPAAASLAVQVRVEQDQVDVALEEVEASLPQHAARGFRLRLLRLKPTSEFLFSVCRFFNAKMFLWCRCGVRHAGWCSALTLT